MRKPTAVELETALNHAAQLREQGEDVFYIAKSLLNLHYRLAFLEDVMHKANLYLHSGEGAHEHAGLVKDIEKRKRLRWLPVRRMIIYIPGKYESIF